MDRVCEEVTPTQRFEVKRLILTGANTGERMALVIDADTRWPVFLINDYLMLALRLIRASSTLVRVACALALFFSWGAAKGVDITARLPADKRDRFGYLPDAVLRRIETIVREVFRIAIDG